MDNENNCTVGGTPYQKTYFCSTDFQNNLIFSFLFNTKKPSYSIGSQLFKETDHVLPRVLVGQEHVPIRLNVEIHLDVLFIHPGEEPPHINPGSLHVVSFLSQGLLQALLEDELTESVFV